MGAARTFNITLLANAGVLIDTGDTRVLVDGLHSESGYPFSRVPEELIGELMHGAGALRDIDYLVFTHAHPDHYDPALVLEYLKYNRVRRLLLPRDDSGRSDELMNRLRGVGQPFWRMGMEPGQIRKFHLNPEFSVSALGMPHMGRQFEGLVCDCLLLELDGRRLLLTGDCDCAAACASLPEGVEADVALVNPYLFHSGEGRAFLRRITRAVIIYHIPFEQDDSLRLRALVRHDLKAYAETFDRLHALTRTHQTIEL